jgi:hypothetical protein
VTVEQKTYCWIDRVSEGIDDDEVAFSQFTVYLVLLPDIQRPLAFMDRLVEPTIFVRPAIDLTVHRDPYDLGSQQVQQSARVSTGGARRELDDFGAGQEV